MTRFLEAPGGPSFSLFLDDQMKSNRDKCDFLLGSSKPDQKKNKIHKLVIPSALPTSLNGKLNNYFVKKQFLSNE